MRNIVVLILLLLVPCMAIHADTIKLKNLKEDIEAKITELTQDYIGVVISEKDIKSVTIQPGEREAYPDLVSLLTSGVKFECKVTSVNPGSIGIRIPKSEVVSLQMVFAPEVAKPEKTVGAELPRPSVPKQEIAKEAETHAIEPPISREAAKEKIKRDVIQELEVEKAPKEETWKSQQVLKEEIKKELKEELETKRKAEEKVFQETELGRVEGRILRKGQPLPDCEVRIIMLVKAKIPLTKSFYQSDMPSEYEGITDSEGRYHLMNVAPGEYKIYWKPPTESGWIRRLNMEPDIIVEAGKTTYPKDIETFKRVIN
ncbi:MAG TPA: carboxypeptidase-like regulatory domain-containing protein [Candidatus Brocadiaceae bacterium]